MDCRGFLSVQIRVIRVIRVQKLLFFFKFSAPTVQYRKKRSNHNSPIFSAGQSCYIIPATHFSKK